VAGEWVVIKGISASVLHEDDDSKDIQEMNATEVLISLCLGGIIIMILVVVIALIIYL
jgi:hypothetical protein